MKTDFDSLKNQFSCVVKAAQNLLEQVGILILLLIEFWATNSARKMFNDTSELSNEKLSSADEFIDVRELSGRIGVKVSTLYSWTSAKIIPHHKFNSSVRFKLSEVLQWARKPENQKRFIRATQPK